MKTEKEIRTEIASIKEQIPKTRRQYAVNHLTARLMALEWVLGKEGVTETLYADCPVCSRRTALTDLGKLRRHNHDGTLCPGSGTVHSGTRA